MKKTFVILLTFITFVSTAVWSNSQAKASTPADKQKDSGAVYVFKTYQQSVVRIETEPKKFQRSSYKKYPLSGLMFKDDGYIAACCKPLLNTAKINVTVYPNQKYEAKIITCDKNANAAIIKIEPKHEVFDYIDLSQNAEPQKDETIFTVGFPFGFAPFVTNGKLTKENDKFTTDAIQPWSEGSPVMNQYGGLIGISTYDRKESKGYIIPIKEFTKLTQSLK